VPEQVEVPEGPAEVATPVVVDTQQVLVDLSDAPAVPEPAAVSQLPEPTLISVLPLQPAVAAPAEEAAPTQGNISPAEEAPEVPAAAVRAVATHDAGAMPPAGAAPQPMEPPATFTTPVAVQDTVIAAGGPAVAAEAASGKVDAAQASAAAAAAASRIPPPPSPTPQEQASTAPLGSQVGHLATGNVPGEAVGPAAPAPAAGGLATDAAAGGGSGPPPSTGGRRSSGQDVPWQYPTTARNIMHISTQTIPGASGN